MVPTAAPSISRVAPASSGTATNGRGRVPASPACGPRVHWAGPAAGLGVEAGLGAVTRLGGPGLRDFGGWPGSRHCGSRGGGRRTPERVPGRPAGIAPLRCRRQRRRRYRGKGSGQPRPDRAPQLLVRGAHQGPLRVGELGDRVTALAVHIQQCHITVLSCQTGWPAGAGPVDAELDTGGGRMGGRMRGRGPLQLRPERRNGRGRHHADDLRVQRGLHQRCHHDDRPPP